MSIFETVKAAVTTRMAAEHYGLQVERNGMTCCPFHGDKQPSMKVDDRYYCFGCHETGDVIDFAAKLFSLTTMEAAKKLAFDFGIDPTTPVAAALQAKQVISEDRRRHAQLLDCMTVMIDYECFLKEQKAKYAPSAPDDGWDKRYIAASNALPRVMGTVDSLFYADDVLQMQMVDQLTASGTLEKVRSYLARHDHTQDGNADAQLAA